MKRILLGSKYHVHKSLPLDLILSDFSLVDTLSLTLFL
jgi:hypothetical protein